MYIKFSTVNLKFCTLKSNYCLRKSDKFISVVFGCTSKICPKILRPIWSFIISIPGRTR
jgi:hypothetical protein